MKYSIFYIFSYKRSHCSFKIPKQNLLESKFYFEGYTFELKHFIENVLICPTKNLNIVKAPDKPIIDQGPHDKYQMDLWYLPKEIRDKLLLNKSWV